MSQMTGSRLLTLSISLVGARVIGAALTFGAHILIARWLGADTLGEFAVAMSLAGVLSIIAAGGYPPIAQRFISKYRIENRPDLIAGFMYCARRGMLVTAFGLMALTWLWLWLRPDGRSLNYTLALALGALSAPAIATVFLNGSIASAFRRPFLGFLPDTLLRPLGLIAVLSLITFCIPTKMGAFELMLITFGVAIGAAAIQWAIMSWRGINVPREVPRTRLDSLWRQSALPLILISLFTNYFIETDILLLSSLLDAEEVGIFNLCARFTAFTIFALHSVNQLALPDLADAHTRADRSGVTRALKRANLAGLGLSLSALIILAAVGRLVLGLVGPQFVQGYMVLVVLSFGQVARAALGSSSVQLMTVMGHQTKALPALLAGFATLIILNYTLVPRLGLDGAGIAMTAATILWSVWLAISARRVTGYDVTLWTTFRNALSRRSDAAA